MHADPFGLFVIRNSTLRAACIFGEVVFMSVGPQFAFSVRAIRTDSFRDEDFCLFDEWLLLTICAVQFASLTEFVPLRLIESDYEIVLVLVHRSSFHYDLGKPVAGARESILDRTAFRVSR
jgi:hypothetical protein